MKFLLISNLYEPYARGGAEAVVKMTAEGFAERGHEVVVVTSRPPLTLPLQAGGENHNSERGWGVRVTRFFPLNLYFVRNDWRYPVIIRFIWRLIDIFNLQAAWKIHQIIKKEKPDIVITHNLVGIGMLTPWVIMRKRVRHIHVLHDVQLVHPSGLLLWGQERRAERNPLRQLYEGLMRHLFGSPDIVIAPSKWLLDFHTSRGFFKKSKTMVLPNPVSMRLHLGTEVAPRHRGCTSGGEVKCQMSNVKCNLLYAGQLEPHKGVVWLLDLRLRIKDLSLIFEFVGSGSLEREVKAATEHDSERIIFCGQLSREELFKKFIEVNALVVPSFCYENAPQIISEALSVGLPVIASLIGGIPELVRDGENGLLFEPGNQTEFAAAIERLPDLVSRMREPMQFLSLETYLDKLQSLAAKS